MKSLLLLILALGSFSVFAQECNLYRGDSVMVRWDNGGLASGTVVAISNDKAIVAVVEREYQLIEKRKVFSMSPDGQLYRGDRAMVAWDAGNSEIIRIGFITQDHVGVFLSKETNTFRQVIECRKLDRLNDRY